MDTYGFLLIAISIVLYLLARKTNPRLAAFFLWTSGVGTGIVAGAIGAYFIVMSALR